MAGGLEQLDTVPGFTVPVHRALTEHILLGGAPRSIAIMNGTLSELVGQSQNATGALQATQAGNQLLALQSQQLSDLVALLAANGRAGALTEAERAAATEQGREQRRRFLTPGSGYQPGNAQMFNNGNN